METLLDYFSIEIANEIRNYFNLNSSTSYKEIEEIRIRNNCPLIIKLSNKEIIFSNVISSKNIIETLERVCENSVYTYQNQICNGFITIKGGHRVGITGNVVMENNRVININYISSMNFRIAKEVFGASDKLIPHIINTNENTVYNTLIVSSPGGGKTTILRDLIRKISNGFNNFQGKTVGLVDERGEIAAMYKGIPQNNIGIRTDVLDNVPKEIGLKILIRSMAPQIIVADEIGSLADIEIINYAICSGIKGIFTAHASSIEELYSNLTIKTLLEQNIFERIVILENKVIKNIYYYNLKEKKWITRINNVF